VDFKLNNYTGVVSLVGHVNLNSLQEHKFKPFVFSGSTDSFLTKDYIAYKAAKNASQASRPNTKVFQIHGPSSSSSAEILNKSQFNHVRSSYVSGKVISKYLSSDPPNLIEEPQILKLGTSTELSDRYGDYFAASPDPFDRSAIWVAGEYHKQPTWSTYIARVHI
jgi:hypothetical protein